MTIEERLEAVEKRLAALEVSLVMDSSQEEIKRMCAEMNTDQGIVSASWDTPNNSTPLDDFKAMIKRILEETRYQHPIEYVSQPRYSEMLQCGYIYSDGTLTPLGNEKIMSSSLAALDNAATSEPSKGVAKASYGDILEEFLRNPPPIPGVTELRERMKNERDAKVMDGAVYRTAEHGPVLNLVSVCACQTPLASSADLCQRCGRKLRPITCSKSKGSQ